MSEDQTSQDDSPSDEPTEVQELWAAAKTAGISDEVVETFKTRQEELLQKLWEDKEFQKTFGDDLTRDPAATLRAQGIPEQFWLTVLQGAGVDQEVIDKVQPEVAGYWAGYVLVAGKWVWRFCTTTWWGRKYCWDWLFKAGRWAWYKVT